jgi:hypothetical protein
MDEELAKTIARRIYEECDGCDGIDITVDVDDVEYHLVPAAYQPYPNAFTINANPRDESGNYHKEMKVRYFKVTVEEKL